MIKNMCNYSVIIPHKNIPNLLQRCLDSIPQRNDLEVIVVDDNSDPSIVDFEQFPGKDRKRTTIIFDKSGKGAGHARNIGLDHAKGKWILFADSDDFYTYCFNDVLNEYANDTSDMIFLNACSLIEGTYLNAERTVYLNTLIEGYLDKNPKKFEQLLRYDIGSPCSKIIRKSLIDKYQISFEETPIHNDVRFSYMTGHYAETIKVDRRAIYCVIYSPTSTSYNLNDEKYKARMRVLGSRIQFAQSLGINLDRNHNVLYQSLMDIHDAGKEELFENCLQILDVYGLSAHTMRRKVNEMCKKRKLDQIKNRWKTFVKRLL